MQYMVLLGLTFSKVDVSHAVHDNIGLTFGKVDVSHAVHGIVGVAKVIDHCVDRFLGGRNQVHSVQLGKRLATLTYVLND